MEEMQVLLEFIDQYLLVIAVALYLIGGWIKPFLKEKDAFLPIILWVISVVLVFGWAVLYTQEKAFSVGVIVYCIVQGAIATGLAVGGSQVLIQLKKYRELSKEIEESEEKDS